MVLNEKTVAAITSEVGSLTRMHNEAQCAAALLHQSQLFLFLLFYFIFDVSAGLGSNGTQPTQEPALLHTGNTDATNRTSRHSVCPLNFGLSLQRC